MNRLFAVIPIYMHRDANNGEQPPRLDLAPMNHAAACNWMQACRNHWTDYRLTIWPESVSHSKPPMLANGYRETADNWRAEGKSQEDIALAFSVSRPTITRVLNGTIWRHVT